MGRRSDSDANRGSSLLDVLLAATLIGLTSSALAGVAHSITPVSRVVTRSLEVTRDIERIQSTMSTDLGKYSTLDDSPVSLPHLPGSNLVTLSDPLEDASVAGSVVPPRYVSYRYVGAGDSGHLIRFHLDDVSSLDDVSMQTTLSTHLVSPPAGWTPGAVVTHAAELSISEESSTGVERVLEIEFADGSHTKVGGRFRHLEPMTVPETPSSAPNVPNIRCGGSVTIVLNTSSTTWSQGAAATVTKDVSDFVTSLIGTPSHVRLLGFDRSSFVLYPETPIGGFVELLNTSTALTALQNRLATLPTNSTNWRNGRNWEDGLWQSTRRDTGTLFSQLPDLVILLTDGSPNRNRTNTTSDTDTTFHTADLTRAAAAADYARSTGSTLIGILLGSGADATAAGHLATVFGSMVWEGSTQILPLDRARSFTRPTAEGFARLDEIFQLISQWRCAGTVTLQQRILVNDSPTPATGSWTFDVQAEGSNVGATATLDQRRPSATIDLGVDDSVGNRQISIAQRPLAGFRHHSATCTASGMSIPVNALTDSGGATILLLSAPARTAVSCTLTAETMP